jgi:hypothetical protein
MTASGDVCACCHAYRLCVLIPLSRSGLLVPFCGECAETMIDLSNAPADGSPAPVPVCPKCGTAGCLEDKALDFR